MSLLKAIKAQLGLSNTPANNFTITAEADNGTLKLARGNAGATTQDLITVSASNLITGANGATLVGNGPAFTATWLNPIGTSTGTIKLQIPEETDTANCYTAGRFQPTVAGYYQINASALFSTSGGTPTAWGLEIRKNNATRSINIIPPYSTLYGAVCVSALVYLNGTTEYVEIWQNCITTGAPVIEYAASSGCLVRAA